MVALRTEEEQQRAAREKQRKEAIEHRDARRKSLGACFPDTCSGQMNAICLASHEDPSASVIWIADVLYFDLSL
jgi:hypothetical protein